MSPELHDAMVAVAKARGVTLTGLLEGAIKRDLGIQTPAAGAAGGLQMTEVA